MKISRLAASVPASKTLAVSARAQELKRQGVDVINLGVGEPDGDPPSYVTEAAHQAIQRGEHSYSPVAGLSELRQAIAAWHRRPMSPEQVLVTHGGKQALHNLFLALLDPDDEVLIPTPAWVSYRPQIEMCGARAVEVPSLVERGFQPDVDGLSAAVTSRTRAIVVNSPSNPTGCVWTWESLAAVADLARRHDLWLISDEIYDRITFDGVVARSIAEISPDAASRTITVHGVAKAFAMTGWRVGWLVGPPELVAAAARIQGHSTSGVFRVTQRAAIAALRGPANLLARNARIFQRRRDLLAESLRSTDGFELPVLPQGAFYLFPRVRSLLGRRTPAGQRLESAMDVAGYLLESGGVAVVPGEAFGDSLGLRFSYSTSERKIVEAGRRVAAAVSRLD